MAVKPKPDPKYLSKLSDTGFELIPLNMWDAIGPRGQMVGKAPIGRDWWSKPPMTLDEASTHMTTGGNIGIPLGKEVGDHFLCAYDIDSSNLPNGRKDVPPLIKAIAEQLEVLLDELVIHQSGNDGLHVFFLSGEADLRGNIELDGIKVELKSKGQQVVAPGSVHPDTGRLYQVHPDSADHATCPIAPGRLIEQFRKPSMATSASVVPPSRVQWIAEQLAQAIQNGTDVFRDYDDWLKAGMAFHAASGGQEYGLSAWIACSDEGEGDHCSYKWTSFGDGDITEKTLTHYLEKVGAKPSDAPALTADEIAEYTASDFADLSADEVAAPRYEKTIRKLFSLDELINLPEPEWLVDHAIPRNGLVVLYGPPKSAKTFLALDIALSMSSDQGQMHGFKVQPGRVLYVLAEGGPAMMGNRARAWMKAKGVDDADIQVFPFGINLSGRKSVDELLKLAGREWDLVVVDTLARCMDGDENSAKDMALAIKGSDYIREKTGAAVLLVHHSGKDQTKGMRGSTALLGAVDATIKMRTQGTMGGFELSVPELRHGEPPEPKWLCLKPTGGSAVLVAGSSPVGKKGSAADVLAFIGSVIADGTPRKEVTDEIAIEFGFTDRTASRRIVEHVPFGKAHAVEVDGVDIWREADIESSSPKAEVIRVAIADNA